MSGTTSGAEHHQQQHDRQQHDGRDEPRQALLDAIAEVGEDRHLAADVGAGGTVRQDVGQDVGAQPGDGVAGGLGLRGRGGFGHQHGDALVADPGGRDLGDARVGRDRVDQRLEDRGVARDVHGDEQRSVRAGAEAPLDEVVGAALGARLRHGALVREAEAERGDRRRERQQQHRGTECVRHRVAADVRAPPTPARADDPGPDVPASVDAVPGQPEQRGKQGDRGEHHHQDDPGDADPAGGDERDPRHGEAEERHDDGAAGENDRATGRRE